MTCIFKLKNSLTVEIFRKESFRVCDSFRLLEFLVAVFFIFMSFIASIYSYD